MSIKRLEITVEYRNEGDDVMHGIDTRIGDGMYVIRHTERVCSMIPLDLIASITEEVID